MVDLVSEDGTGLPNANSYPDLTFGNEYFDAHPFYSDAWSELSSDRRKKLLISGSRQLDLLMSWRGYPFSETQSMQHPRIYIYDDVGRPLSFTSYSRRLKEAACEMAFHLSRGDPFAPSSSEGLDALKIDVIELQFSKSDKPVAVPAPVLALLNGLADYTFGRRIRKVLVG